MKKYLFIGIFPVIIFILYYSFWLPDSKANALENKVIELQNNLDKYKLKPQNQSDSVPEQPKNKNLAVKKIPTPVIQQPTTTNIKVEDPAIKVARCQAEAQAQKDSDTSFAQGIIDQTIQNNPLLRQRELLIKFITTGQLSSQETSELSTENQNLILTYGKTQPNVIWTQIGIINNQVTQQSIAIRQQATAKTNSIVQDAYNAKYLECLNK